MRNNKSSITTNQNPNKGNKYTRKLAPVNEFGEHQVTSFKHKCRICDYKTYSTVTITLHTTQRQQYKHITCNICGEKLTGEDKLEPHMNKSITNH